MYTSKEITKAEGGKMTKRFSLLLTLCVFFSFNVYAIEAFKPNKFSKYQKKAQDYNNVCMISLGDVGLTGTLIAPEFVLTCAHGLSEYCKKGVPTILKNPGLIIFNRKIKKGLHYKDLYHTDTILLHPKYNARECENDVALIRLNRPVEGIEPMSITNLELSKEIRETLRAGKSLNCEIVGYGEQDLDPKQQRLAADAKSVTRFDEEFSKNSFCLPRKKLGGAPGGLTNGDSGGPLIYKGKLIGINVAVGGYAVTNSSSKVTEEPAELFDISCSVIDLKGSSWEAGIKSMFEKLGLDHGSIGRSYPASRYIKTYSDDFAFSLLAVLHIGMTAHREIQSIPHLEFKTGTENYAMRLTPEFVEGYKAQVLKKKMLPNFKNPDFESALKSFLVQKKLSLKPVAGHTHALVVDQNISLPFTLAKVTR